jgi:hypothetical protein
MIIYVVIYFLVGLISIFVDKIVKMTIAPFVSGLLGAFLGVLKGVVLCSIILSATTAFVRPDQPFYRESSAWPFIQPLSDRVKEWVPPNLRRLMTPTAAARSLREETTPKSGETLAAPTDFQSLKKILSERGDLISAGWLEKFRNLTGPEALDPDDLKRFIRDHPNLFKVAPAVQPTSRPAPVQPSPSWPSPAVE